MNIPEALKTFEKDQLKKLSRKDLEELTFGEQHLRMQLEALVDELSQEKFELQDKYIIIKNLLFSPKSEKTRPRPPRTGSGDKGKKESKPKAQKPSERYPDAEVLETIVEQEPPPKCSCCSGSMSPSGLYDESEMLTVVPKKFLVNRQLLIKYRCLRCPGQLTTCERPPRIKPGSSYSG